MRLEVEEWFASEPIKEEVASLYKVGGFKMSREGIIKIAEQTHTPEFVLELKNYFNLIKSMLDFGPKRAGERRAVSTRRKAIRAKQ